jgi:transcriptional regulator CtsR
MGTTDIIARFILDMLEESEGSAELQRSSLAERFNCVPSQINYVISTRFSPERGYVVESRRGGGGYIRIRRVATSSPRQLIMHTVNSIGEELDLQTAAAFLSNAIHQPKNTIQIRLAMKDIAPPPNSISFLNGKNDMDANLKHCFPQGIPMIVMQQTSPANHQDSPLRNPPNMNQRILPNVLIVFASCIL